MNPEPDHLESTCSQTLEAPALSRGGSRWLLLHLLPDLGGPGGLGAGGVAANVKLPGTCFPRPWRPRACPGEVHAGC
jgi:hypothetical protein